MHETESGARGSLTHRTSRDLAISKTRAGRESTLRGNRAGTKGDKFCRIRAGPSAAGIIQESTRRQAILFEAHGRSVSCSMYINVCLCSRVCIDAYRYMRI
jgi:hypothetical protein